MNLRDASLLREQCFVGGRWVGMPATAVTYPATGEALARVPHFGAAENDAITSAHAPFIVFDDADDDGVDEFLKAKYMLIGGLNK